MVTIAMNNLLILFCLCWLDLVIPFAFPGRQRSFARTIATKCAESRTLTTPDAVGQGFDTSAAYTDQELLAALSSLLDDSDNPDFDARHIYGYGDPNHTISMLQRVTATVLLDYENYMKNNQHPSIPELSQIAESFSRQHGPILNLQEVIQSQAPRMALAAEFKRASPSKGDIAPDLEAGPQGLKYATAGADIISVLTEARWFKGTLRDLTEIRLATTTSAPDNNRRRPAMLRKDFCVNEYMIAEAAAVGADTILLIVAVLPQHLLTRLIDYSRSLGMEPLVEVHADAELEVALEAGAKVIGVNNRNLHTFQLDMTTSERVARELSTRGLSFHHHRADEDNATEQQLTICALSGMSTANDVDRYRNVGLGMCLIGESLMRAADPVAAIASLCLHPDDFARQQKSGTLSTTTGGGAYTAGTQLVKVCGITNADDALVACRAGANLIGVIFANKSSRKVTAEQARQVVQAVREFGERRTAVRIQPPNAPNAAPLPHLVASTAALMEAARPSPMVVGVFQNHDLAFVRDMVQQCGLDLVQLHGSEGMAAASQCGVPAIRVVDVAVDAETGETSSGVVETLLESITTDPVAILLDTAIKGDKAGGGGTGAAFNWSIAEQIQNAGLPVILAGGLTPETVGDCVGSTRPFGVDVGSGVETSPGIKDHQKVRDFVQGARKAALEASKGF